MNRILRATVLVAVAVIAAGCAGGDATTTGSPSSAASQALVGNVAPASPSIRPASSPTSDSPTSPASATPPEPSPTAPSSTPRPTSRPTPSPTETPIDDGGEYTEQTPPPKPRAVIALDGRSISSMYVQVGAGGAHLSDLHVGTRHLDRDKCRLTHVTTPDKPGIAPSKEALRPVDQQIAFIDGRHELRLACPSARGTIRDTMVVVAVDGLPERCLGFDFPKADISVSTIDGLMSGMVGTWHGCVTTPWTIMYGVDVTFRADGTYSASSGEVLDGQTMTALYYGTDDDSPLKQWWINDFQASNKGVGEIDIVFDAKGVVRDELRNVKLMGDQLELELFHMGQYGPVLVQLFRD